MRCVDKLEGVTSPRVAASQRGWAGPVCGCQLKSRGYPAVQVKQLICSVLTCRPERHPLLEDSVPLWPGGGKLTRSRM